MTSQVATDDAGGQSPPTSETAISATAVTVRYGDKVAVNNVDFTVKKGEVMGLIGPNGAGKTSLVECIEGLRTPASGDIRVFGIHPTKERTKMALLAGVQLQDSAYPPRTKVDELCKLFAGFYPNPLDWEALLEQFNLTEKRRSQITKLSGGQRQRLSLVLALIGQPTIVFLDELTAGLDPEARRMVWNGLRARNDDGLTIVLTSHHMDEVEYLCDRVSVMVDGEIVGLGTIPELIEQYAGSNERIIVENASSHDDLRSEIEALGDGVVVTSAGSRFHIDLTDGSLRESVEGLIAKHKASTRTAALSMDDVYVSLTKGTAKNGSEK